MDSHDRQRVNAIGEHQSKKQFLMTQLAGTVGVLTGVHSYKKRSLPSYFLKFPLLML